MERNIDTGARIAALREESEAIHSANTMYWTSNSHSREATADYHRRLKRLEEIRKEFEQLTSSSKPGFPGSNS